MELELLIEKFSKESLVSEQEIKNLMEEISYSLVREGCSKDNNNHMIYLIRRIRKRLKIEESKTYQSFKQFFQKGNI